MSIKDDKELVELTTKDPEKGFRYLMTKYKEVVYWHIRRLVVAHEDAQDATQETFVRVFRSFAHVQLFAHVRIIQPIHLVLISLITLEAFLIVGMPPFNKRVFHII